MFPVPSWAPRGGGGGKLRNASCPPALKTKWTHLTPVTLRGGRCHRPFYDEGRGSERVGDCRARPRGQWEEAQGLGPSLVLAACCLAACRHVHVSGWRGLRVSVSARASGCNGALCPAPCGAEHSPSARGRRSRPQALP